MHNDYLLSVKSMVNPSFLSHPKAKKLALNFHLSESTIYFQPEKETLKLFL